MGTDAMDELWFYGNILLFERSAMLATRTSTENCSHRSTSSENRQPAYKNKRPARLSALNSQPLFQLQSQLRAATTQRKKLKSHKSLSELESYELKGFTDLGFMFPPDKLSPVMMSMVPGLQRLRENDETAITRPYLSEAWLVNEHDLPLLNLGVLPKALDGADLKKRIKFWARKVAMLVHGET